MGAILVVPALITYWRGTQRVQSAARISGREPVNGWIALLLYVVLSIGFWAYLQASLNEVWRAEAEPLAGEPPLPPAPEQQLPARLPDEAHRT